MLPADSVMGIILAVGVSASPVACGTGYGVNLRSQRVPVAPGGGGERGAHILWRRDTRPQV